MEGHGRKYLFFKKTHVLRFLQTHFPNSVEFIDMPQYETMRLSLDLSRFRMLTRSGRSEKNNDKVQIEKNSHRLKAV